MHFQVCRHAHAGALLSTTKQCKLAYGTLYAQNASSASSLHNTLVASSLLVLFKLLNTLVELLAKPFK